ncbi:MAG: hypothetical protein OEW19_18980 [Acidobacteriota bacterium]|nr:hypothetical protein [Acidobacteriota bacterium]
MSTVYGVPATLTSANEYWDSRRALVFQVVGRLKEGTSRAPSGARALNRAEIFPFLDAAHAGPDDEGAGLLVHGHVDRVARLERERLDDFLRQDPRQPGT